MAPTIDYFVVVVVVAVAVYAAMGVMVVAVVEPESQKWEPLSWLRLDSFDVYDVHPISEVSC